MFTSGRIAFIIFFILLFAGYLVWAYRADIKKSPAYFKGSIKIVLGIVTIIVILVAISRWVL